MTKWFTTALICLAMGACSPKLSSSSPLFGSRWVLQTLSGVPVQTSGSDKDAHLQFERDGNRVSGTGGCNRVMGSFEADGKKKMQFSPLASTKMACPDLAFEEKFLEELNKTKFYTFAQDGTLQLKDGKGNVLATFSKR